jgi:DNA-binding CsgD family transcriptional regulator
MGFADISSVVDLAYAAALDDALWWQWAERMIGAFSSQGALFWVIDSAQAEMSRSAFHFRDVDLEALAAEYLGGPVFHDPQMKRVISAERTEVYSDLDHVDLECPSVREYVAWQVARVGTSHHLTLVSLLSDTLRAGISLHTSPEVGPASSQQRAMLTALMPDIARALHLGMRHAELLQAAWWEGVREHLGSASLLLDDQQRILRVAGSGERMLMACDGLGVRGGRLVAADVEADHRLQAAIQNAVRDRDARADAIAAPRVSGRRPYQVLVYPLVKRRRFLAPFAAAALIHIVQPDLISSHVTSLQRRVYGLTPRETQVANLLLAGHSLESLAATLQISRNTVRVHLQALFRKTACNRQSDLVRLLLAQGPSEPLPSRDSAC